ncbi:MAG: N-acetylmuramoyl-L-alanine amidase [Flavobacteriales bacterium]|nr:N-acetylmuramoyl-L-alanine amidase [Flavobacteriales bacterium]
MNKLKYLVIHCTATEEGRHFTKDDIIVWHTSPKPKGRGWNRPGYSDIVLLDGTLQNIVPFNQDDYVDLWEITNGVKGLNGHARHIVYVGGLEKDSKENKDTRTEAQKETLEVYVRYHLKRHPDILIMGHYQAPTANGKSCPNFNVPEWLKEIGVPKENIYAENQ